jgi:hypothetical protein
LTAAEATDPLSGALQKLDRAEGHLWEVNRLANGWERFGRPDKPYALNLQVEPTEANAIPHPVYHFALHEQLPAELPLVIGDCIHNLRGALDYIAWVLTRDDRRPNDKQIQFPIFESAWDEKSQTLAGLTDEACQDLHKLQPFHGPNRTNRPTHDLANLARLSNWDKHRQLVIGGLGPGISSWYGGRPDIFYAGPFVDGSIVMEFPPDVEVSPSPNFASLIVFDEPEYVRRQAPDLTLGNIREYIRDVVIPTMRPHVFGGT